MTVLINKSNSDSYSIIPNYYLLDDNLTWEEKGFLTYLLASVEQVEIKHDEDEITNRKLFRSLFNKGYIAADENMYGDYLYHFDGSKLIPVEIINK